MRTFTLLALGGLLCSLLSVPVAAQERGPRPLPRSENQAPPPGPDARQEGPRRPHLEAARARLLERVRSLSPEQRSLLRRRLAERLRALRAVDGGPDPDARQRAESARPPRDGQPRRAPFLQPEWRQPQPRGAQPQRGRQGVEPQRPGMERPGMEQRRGMEQRLRREMELRRGTELRLRREMELRRGIDPQRGRLGLRHRGAERGPGHQLRRELRPDRHAPAPSREQGRRAPRGR